MGASAENSPLPTGTAVVSLPPAMSSAAVQTTNASTYRTRLATGPEDVRAAQHLRFEVFNVELREGLAGSWQTELDVDRFDEACDHLLVEHTATGAVVGTYRLQTGAMAAEKHGYYSEQEFDFGPFEPFRHEIVELGRACVHFDHRKLNVLNLLWRGIADYAGARNAKYLIGCSSLTSQDAALGHAMFAQIATTNLAPAQFLTTPHPAFTLPPAAPLDDCPPPPRLLRAYLAVGARICGPPALDREFGTIDFLTLLALEDLPAAFQNHYIA
jgi:putative hemolysin